jgi:hypothetical protein
MSAAISGTPPASPRMSLALIRATMVIECNIQCLEGQVS